MPSDYTHRNMTHLMRRSDWWCDTSSDTMDNFVRKKIVQAVNGLCLPQVRILPDGWDYPTGASFLVQSLTVYYGLKSLGNIQVHLLRTLLLRVPIQAPGKLILRVFIL